ncbi:hypothetical protein llap_8217 [Limosa lapponica baueri]|uniref:Rna-directed dna polymerase from mobile element jockey-like n=1 Tax=Limosa lapponica baueri TaxID=1758121 RepID=A0A2I0U603_LIMLA|nr:hypothetical protein llap_8217 [Limosa lapponica baueri]
MESIIIITYFHYYTLFIIILLKTNLIVFPNSPVALMTFSIAGRNIAILVCVAAKETDGKAHNKCTEGGIFKQVCTTEANFNDKKDVCWKFNAVERKESRRILEYVENNFLTQPMSKPTRDDALLDLLFASRKGLVGDVMVGGRLGPGDHEMIGFDSRRRKGICVSRGQT